MGAGLAGAGPAHRHARAHARIAADRGLDRSRPCRRAALDQGQVLAQHPPLGDRLLQAPVGLLGARHHQQARGVAVQPVHDPGALGLTARQQRRRGARRGCPRGVPGRGARPPRAPLSMTINSSSWRTIENESGAAHGEPRRPCSATRNSSTMPIVMDASARLNGGQPSGNLTKSVTSPWRTRSRMLPIAPPEQHARGQPDQGTCDVAGEVHQQHHQRERDQDRDADMPAGEEAEGDALVAGVDQLHAGQEAAFFAGHDRAFDGVLGELVHDHDDDRHQRHEQPRAQHRALGPGRTMEAALHRSLSRG